MNLLKIFISEEKIPDNFGGLINLTFFTYKRFFSPYLMISSLIFLPLFATFELLESKENTLDSLLMTFILVFLVSKFFDLTVFLTVPTLASTNKVLPLATLRLFFGQFLFPTTFLSVVNLLILIFFGVLLFMISPAFVLFDFIVYLFLIFAGNFLILNADHPPYDLKRFFSESYGLVKSNFGTVLASILNIIMISLFFMFLSMFVFKFIYILANFDISDGNMLLADESVNQRMMEHPAMKWGFYFTFIIIRPIESIYLSYLFLSLMSKLNFQSYRNYAFGLKENFADTTGATD